MNDQVFLITDPTHPAVSAAASDMRPTMHDGVNLPQRIKFAPNQVSYKVQRDGQGVFVYLYGTDTEGHSIAVRAEGFRPYFLMSLDPIDKHTQDPIERDALVRQLIDELQTLLLGAAMYSTYTWSAERVAFCASLAGHVRTNKNKTSCALVPPETRTCLPIVDWDIVQGIPVRGSGEGAGYRGMKQTRFLQLYMYAPSLVPRCHQILQGKFAEMAPADRAYALSRYRPREMEGPQQIPKTVGIFRYMEDDAENKAAEASTRRRRQDPFADEDGDEEEAAAVAPMALEDPEEEYENELLREQPRDAAELETMAVEVTPEVPSSVAAADATEDSEMEEGDRQVVWYPFDGDNQHPVRLALDQRLERRFKRRVERRLNEIVQASSITAQMRFDAFEADIDFVLRFSVDCGFAYEQWIELDCTTVFDTAPNGDPLPSARAGVQRVYQSDSSYYWKRETLAQIELRCDYRAIRFREDDPIQNTIPKHVRLSLDCEMLIGHLGRFPNPQTEPMVTCCCIIKDERTIEGRPAKPPGGGKYGFWYRSVSFVLGGRSGARGNPRTGCYEQFVLCFENEVVLYRALIRFVRILGPTIVTGYNTDGFDLPYLLARAQKLGIGSDFSAAWGRSMRSPHMRITDKTFRSSAVAKVDYKEVKAEGVTFLDFLLMMKKQPGSKYRSISLNSVAATVLGEQKEDVSYSLINTLYVTAAGREALRYYCEKDALLPLMLMEKLQTVPSMVEMARINGCTMDQLLKRGQQIRSMCCLYREARQVQPPHFVHTRSEAERELSKNDTFEGANVIDPEVGLFEYPTATLDWASLYPSIMCTWNFCFSTYVAPDYNLHEDRDIMGCDDPMRDLTLEERNRRADAAVYTLEELETKEPFSEAAKPKAARFLRHNIKVGLAVHTEMKLLAWRERVKKEAKKAKDDGETALAALLDERQLQIKLLCNSLYGSFGAKTSRFYCQAVSASVTARGRALLYKMRWIAMTDFAQHEPRITYGDTDSIFVLYPKCVSVEAAAQLGVQMAVYITECMQRDYSSADPRFTKYNILRLEFEKVFHRLFLIAKKRYAGLLFKYDGKDNLLRPVPGDCIPVLSGLEAKRRDTTLLIKREITHVISLLLDYHYTVAENLLRAREYVWRTMVRPLMRNTMDLWQLCITKQLRDSPADFIKKHPKMALPVHTHLWQKLIERAGGLDKPNAPRSGDRLAYVIVQEEPGAKVSSRAEVAPYVLEHKLPVDGLYYLNNQVRAPLLRLFGPIYAQVNAKQQRKLTDDKNNMRELTEKDRERIEEENELVAAEFLFGHQSLYQDTHAERFVGQDIVPATLKMEQEDITKQVAEGRIGVVPLRSWRTNSSIKQPRYSITSDVLMDQNKPVVTTSSGQRSLFSFGPAVAVGVRCRLCGTFGAGKTLGYVCDGCLARSPEARAKTMEDAQKYLVDIEDLRVERAAIAATCHDCMGCSEAPRFITCENCECPVFWQRKFNQLSERAVGARLAATREMIYKTGTVEKLELEGELEDDDDEDE